MRLRDLGKIWVLALAPRSRPLQSSTLRYLKAAPVTRSLFSRRRLHTFRVLYRLRLWQAKDCDSLLRTVAR